MGVGLQGRGLGVRERPGSLEAGFRELALHGAGLQHPRDLQFGLSAPQSLQLPPLWWPWGVRESTGQLDLARAGPTSPSLGGV